MAMFISSFVILFRIRLSPQSEQGVWIKIRHGNNPTAFSALDPCDSGFVVDKREAHAVTSGLGKDGLIVV